MVDYPQLFLNKFSEMIETILPDLMSFGRLGPVLTPQAAKSHKRQTGIEKQGCFRSPVGDQRVFSCLSTSLPDEPCKRPARTVVKRVVAQRAF